MIEKLFVYVCDATYKKKKVTREKNFIVSFDQSMKEKYLNKKSFSLFNRKRKNSLTRKK